MAVFNPQVAQGQDANYADVQAQVSARWREIQALAARHPEWRQGVVSPRANYGAATNPNNPANQTNPYTRAARELGIRLPSNAVIRPDGRLEHSTSLGEALGAAGLIVGGTLATGGALNGTPAAGAPAAEAGGFTGVGGAGTPLAAETGGALTPAGAAPAIHAAMPPAAGGIPGWLKSLAKIAPAAIGAATIKKSDVGTPGDQVASILKAFPQLQDLLNASSKNVKQSQPLNEAIKQMALNFMPKSSRSAYPGVPDVRGIE